VAVAVLEVHPQVLDGFAFELGAHPAVDVLGEGRVESEDGGEGGGVGGVFVEGGERLVAPGPDGAGREDVAGNVDGVDGLTGAGVPGVAALQLGVDRREGGADLLADGTREARRHPLLLTLPHSSPSWFPLYGINNPQNEVICRPAAGQHRLTPRSTPPSRHVHVHLAPSDQQRTAPTDANRKAEPGATPPPSHPPHGTEVRTGRLRRPSALQYSTVV